MNFDRDADLALSLLGATLATSVVIFLPSLIWLRVLLGVPFVLLLPGFTLLAALYPRRRDMDSVERLSLSVGLSLALVSLIGLGLNFTPWGIRLIPIAGSLTGFVFLMTVLAFYRRQQVPENQRSEADLLSVVKSRITHISFDPLPIVFAVSIGCVVFFMVFVAIGRADRSEGFTEFYLLDVNGSISDLPEETSPGEATVVKLAVENQEGQPASYNIVISTEDEKLATLKSFTLGNGEALQEDVSFTLIGPGQRRRVDFLLYREGVDAPYRMLHLWLRVRPG